MIETKLKLWSSAGAAALLGAGALALSACSPAENKEEAAKTEAAKTAPAAAESGEGEAGAQGLLSGLSGEALANARLQQLKGFLLVAQRVSEGNTGADAGVLVNAGLAEVYDEHVEEFAGLDIAPLREADFAHLNEKPRAEVARRLQAAIDAASRLQRDLDGNPADLAIRMTNVAAGIYQEVVREDGSADPTEYQHSLGAALSAREALTRNADALRARNAARYEAALRELDAFIELWPAPNAPQTPTPANRVAAAASQIELTLSNLR